MRRDKGKMRGEGTGERHLTDNVCSCSSIRREGVYLVVSLFVIISLGWQSIYVRVDVCIAYLLIIKLSILILESHKQTKVARSILINSGSHHLDTLLMLFCASSF